MELHIDLVDQASLDEYIDFSANGGKKTKSNQIFEPNCEIRQAELRLLKKQLPLLPPLSSSTPSPFRIKLRLLSDCFEFQLHTSIESKYGAQV